MTIQPEIVILGEFQSLPFFPLDTRAPGTFEKIGEIKGNSLLTTVFVESIDAGASLKVNFYDTTLGELVGERYDLNSHDLITPASGPFPKAFRLLTTRMHHRVVCEAIVTGGNARFSVYATPVSSFASDLDSSLVKDAQTFDASANKALPTALLDPTDGKLYFLRGNRGNLTVEQDVGVPVPLRIVAGTQTTPSASAILISQTVPAGKAWRLRSLRAACRAWGYFTVKVGGSQVGLVNSGPASENPQMEFDPYELATAGQTVEVSYTQTTGPAMNIAGTLFIAEVDA